MNATMESRKEKNGWKSVPQFGGWDQKRGAPDYSRIFSRVRANRKQQKREVRRSTVGNEAKAMAHRRRGDNRVTKKQKLLSYLHCCTMA